MPARHGFGAAVMAGLISLLLGGCAATAGPQTLDPNATAMRSDTRHPHLSTELASLGPAPGDELAALPKPKPQPPETIARSFTGVASWYGPKFHGRLTASGEPFDMAALTAAHQTLPFGSRVRVTNLDNGRSVVVVINDRGPYKKGRVIDLSRAAAKRLDIVDDGVAKVRLDVLADASS